MDELVFHNERLEETTISVTSGDGFNLIRDCELRDCIVESHVPSRALVIRDSVFWSCTIHARSPLVKFSWRSNRIVQSAFRGRYVENDFGDPSGGAPRSLEDCDFRDAILDDCLFYDCSAPETRFPGWPHITVLEPWSIAEAMAATGSDLIADIGASYREFPSTLVAIVHYAPSLAKEYSITEAAVREQFEGFRNVRL